MPNDPKSPFPTTRWSLIASAKGDQDDNRRSLEDLCRIYWPALYAYARKRGQSIHDAEDLTQGFLTSLLQRDGIDKVDCELGKFRTFLLTGFQRFMTTEWRKTQSGKRDVAKNAFSLNGDELDRVRELPDSSKLSPERAFERRWASALLKQTLSRLQDEYQAKNKTDHFEALSPFIQVGAEPDYPAAAEALNLGVGTVRVYVQRLRNEYQATIRSEIAETLLPGADVEEELQALLAAYGS